MIEIFIANTAEAFATLLVGAGSDSNRAAHECDLSGRALFWGGAEKIVVTSGLIDPVFVAHTATLLNLDRLEVWRPARTSVRLCSDILADADLLARLRRTADGRDQVCIRPYAVTPEFCALSDHMEWGSWHAALEAVVELDSKAGFRRKFDGAELALPEGSICIDIFETAAAVYAFTSQGCRAVIKVHNGESGWGLHFVDAIEVTTLSGCQIKVRSLFESDAVWSQGPYIVEKFISHDRSNPGFSPSGEATIDNSGVHFDYLCNQVMNDDGEFVGVCIGGEVERSPVADEIRLQTLVVGEALRARSYRGTFDVDFIVASNGGIFAVESNVRLTGGTHVMGAARALFGDQWRNWTFVSNDCICYGIQPIPASVLLERLVPLLFRREDKRGIIVSFISTCRPVLGAIAVGVDRADAMIQLQTAKRLLLCEPNDC